MSADSTNIQKASSAPTTISTMRLNGRGIWIVAVSSMEQVIGAGLSTVIGIMLPMLQLVIHPELPSALQGIIGAMGLVGIAVGSPIIGKLSDRQGYLLWFRICPFLIIAGALICYFFTSIPCLIFGLFIAGAGVGGGYSLDSDYISELLPNRWRQTMVGVAKATSSIGFIAVALICMVILRAKPDPSLWNSMILIIAAMGLAALLMRLHWAESPKWLMSRGRIDEAKAAVRLFYGDGVLPDQEETPAAGTEEKTGWAQMFKGTNLKRVIFSGVPWACEGLGVYGFGVFLPVLVMALGIGSNATGMHSVINSVEITALVNFFILPGFIIGLLFVNRCNHVKMMTWGFVGSAAGLALLYIGYITHAADWILVLGFVIYEVTLNAGPHLITYIIPSQIYPVEVRGTGTGIAAMVGKLGAILGVVIMPILLSAGGAKLVLVVSIIVMLAGAAISIIYGRLLGLTASTKQTVKQ